MTIIFMNLWPLTSQNTIDFLHSIRFTYKWNIRSTHALLLETLSIQDYHHLTTVDPIMTFNLHKNSSLLVLNNIYRHAKYEIYISFHYWDIMFTAFSLFEALLSPNDRWSCALWGTYSTLIKYDIFARFPSWDVEFTRFHQKQQASCTQ